MLAWRSLYPHTAQVSPSTGTVCSIWRSVAPAALSCGKILSRTRHDLADSKAEEQTGGQQDEEGKGRMSERLEQLTEEMMEQGGRGARRAVEDAGFSEVLKAKLEARLLDSKFRSENPSAFAEMSMPSSASKETRKIATSEPWAGDEALEDAALRMLNDASKPMHISRPKIRPPKVPSSSVDLRMRKAALPSAGQRLANARDRTSRYALSQDETLSEKEREEMRKLLKDRFTSGARPMPTTLQGLASLANERIEDAIARGQFKNITRGKGHNVERDHNADSPFLDTTEYFMNKIIQKQDIVPPWIEKQQELVKAASVFRARIRNDWKRHAARTIASRGGTLEEQVQRAQRYAEAEAAANPVFEKKEALTEIDAEGKLSQVTITEKPTPSSNTSENVIITVSEDLASEVTSPMAQGPDSTTSSDKDSSSSPSRDVPPSPIPRPSLFRDPNWLEVESGYHNLAIRDLNNTTRSYNLQAPDLAKKPYFSLDRELRSCYADVAPQVADMIRERARQPERIRVEVIGHRPGGVLEKFSAAETAKVYDSRKPNYGFKDFWKDLWGGDGAQA